MAKITIKMEAEFDPTISVGKLKDELEEMAEEVAKKLQEENNGILMVVVKSVGVSL